MTRPPLPRYVTALTLALAPALAGCSQAPPVVTTPPAVVTVDTPVVMPLRDYEDFTGRTAAVETVEVRAQVTGYLKMIFFKEGSEVKGGELHPTVAAGVVGHMASPLREGAILTAAATAPARSLLGDLLFLIDPSIYEAAVAQARANLEVARATVKEREAAYEIAYSAGIGTSRLELAQRLGQLQVAQAEAVAAQAVLQKAEIDLSFCSIRAPITGQIGRYQVTVGNLVKPDQTVLTTIVTQDPMYVYFDVDELTLDRIKKLVREGKVKTYRDKEIGVQMGLAADGDKRPHQGTINFVDNQLNPGTGTISVRAVFPNPVKNNARLLSPNMFVRVRMPVGETRERVLISDRAIGTDQGRKFVFVVNDKNEAVMRPVEVGRKEGKLRIIESGLQPGERVIVNGLQRVREGAVVDPRPPEAEGKSKAK